MMGVSSNKITKMIMCFVILSYDALYYNLINWYKHLISGFKMNRQFMEQMMGLKYRQRSNKKIVNTPSLGKSTRWFKLTYHTI